MKSLVWYSVAILLVLTQCANSAFCQQFDSIRHRVSAAFVGNDPYGDDFPSDSEAIASRKFQQFYGDLNLGIGGPSALSSLSSDLDPTAGWFYAYGYASTGIYVQGSASADASSDFRTDFTLATDGQIELTGVVGVSDFLGYNQSRDVPGFAQVFVRVRDLNANRNVINEVVTMNGYVPNASGLIQIDLEDEFSQIALPAGRYRLIISAASNDSAFAEQVEGSLAVAFFEVEGNITEN